MKIAIIGSGFFGTAVAIILSEKYSVDLFEEKNSILQGASSSNQYRFHLGYHYPRSIETIKKIKETNIDFVNFYGHDHFGNTKNYYGIARKNSRTKLSSYLEILDYHKLDYQIVNNEALNSKAIEGVIKVDEKILNYFTFKKNVKSLLKKNNVNLFLMTKFSNNNINNYDKIIIATYNNNNSILNELGLNPKTKYEYQLVEKILIKLPPEYSNDSYVIIDGEFVNIDPYLGTNYHLLSDVKYSKIEKTISYYPEFNDVRKKYVNQGMISEKNLSNFKSFINNSKYYLPFLNYAEYKGSYFTIRTIRPNLEDTDERLGNIELINNKFITIFSSKWNSCISTAYQIRDLI